MDKSVENYITSLSNADLLVYIKAGPERYLPEAIEFAQEELTRRNLSSEQFKEVAVELKERVTTFVATSTRSLAMPYKIIAFLCGFLCGIPLLLFIPVLIRYHEQGEYRKIRDVWFFGLFGLFIPTVMIWLRIPPWSQLGVYLPIFVLFVILDAAFGLRIFGKTMNRKIAGAIGLALCAVIGYLVWIYLGGGAGIMRNVVRNSLLGGLIPLCIYCLVQIFKSPDLSPETEQISKEKKDD